ncbi:MAG: phosphoribosylglycinamide formyltransferase [Betaproteobacteria bacterium]|nr:phosphoribosylglycinamide formyltransferase [Betaproteobacteria bacterium]
MKRIVILISGRGSNLQAVLEAKLNAAIAAVISNNPTAKGLQIAHDAGVESKVVNHRDYPDRTNFDRALADTIAAYRPDLIVLAGFMRILTEEFIERFSGRIMNIHPSLLPAFPGLDTHRRAIDEGVKLHGCTVHFVTPTLDHGPIVIQAAVPVLPDDDEERLAARVLEQEHAIYVQAIRWFLDDQLAIEGNHVKVSASCQYTGSMISPLPR